MIIKEGGTHITEVPRAKKLKKDIEFSRELKNLTVS